MPLIPPQSLWVTERSARHQRTLGSSLEHCLLPGSSPRLTHGFPADHPVRQLHHPRLPFRQALSTIRGAFDPFRGDFLDRSHPAFREDLPIIKRFLMMLGHEHSTHTHSTCRHDIRTSSILTLMPVYLFLPGTNATSVTLFSSSTKSTVASPLDNVASLG